MATVQNVEEMRFEKDPKSIRLDIFLPLCIWFGFFTGRLIANLSAGTELSLGTMLPTFPLFSSSLDFFPMPTLWLDILQLYPLLIFSILLPRLIFPGYKAIKSISILKHGFKMDSTLYPKQSAWKSVSSVRIVENMSGETVYLVLKLKSRLPVRIRGLNSMSEIRDIVLENISEDVPVHVKTSRFLYDFSMLFTCSILACAALGFII